MKEDKKGSESLFLMVLVAALSFFGTAAWIILRSSAEDQFRWVADVFSALLFISVFFWLLVLESFKGGN